MRARIGGIRCDVVLGVLFNDVLVFLIEFGQARQIAIFLRLQRQPLMREDARGEFDGKAEAKVVRCSKRTSIEHHAHVANLLRLDPNTRHRSSLDAISMPWPDKE